MTDASTDLLTGLVASARRQAAERREVCDEVTLARLVRGRPEPRDLHAALSAPGLGVIAEAKRRSPSAGMLVEDYHPADLAARYTRGGAAAISVLTHRDGFDGTCEDIATARTGTHLPILRKDFVVEEYQVLEARAFGADAVLLIVAALPEERLRELMDLTHRLGMAALVEVHDAAEADTALRCGATIVGVNHRDLRDLRVDLGLTGQLRGRIGPDRLVVAESGIAGVADARRLRAAGADAVLVGEWLLRATDPLTRLEELVDL